MKINEIITFKQFLWLILIGSALTVIGGLIAGFAGFLGGLIVIVIKNIYNSKKK